MESESFSTVTESEPEIFSAEQHIDVRHFSLYRKIKLYSTENRKFTTSYLFNISSIFKLQEKIILVNKECQIALFLQKYTLITLYNLIYQFLILSIRFFTNQKINFVVLFFPLDVKINLRRLRDPHKVEYFHRPQHPVLSIQTRE